jgi:hypothetical protein
VAGAKLGFDLGLAILTWVGVGFLAASVAQGFGELVTLLTAAIRRGWAAGDKTNLERGVEIEAAAKDLAKAVGVLMRLILEGILAYLMRKAPMSTTRTAAGTVGRVRAAGSEAVAAETVAELVTKLRGSRLGKGFGDWVEVNWQKLLENPKLRRYPPSATAPSSGAASGKTQTPSEALQGVEGGRSPAAPGETKPVDSPRKTKLEPGTPEHKADRWKRYQERGGQWEYDRWSKQYDTNMQNVSQGCDRGRGS